jgi:heterodisulfide reductase subunit A-like polyferredoxin
MLLLNQMSRGRVFSIQGLLSTLLSEISATSTCKANNHQYHVDEVIDRDVTIIGGGSAGMYSAIRLTDLDKSVAVIEKSGRLGGNTETYIDPVMGSIIRHWCYLLSQI